MPPTVTTSPGIRSEMRELRARGLTYDQIAAQTGYSRKVIARVVAVAESYFLARQGGEDNDVPPRPKRTLSAGGRPILSLADVRTGVIPGRPSHPWWPGVSTRCAACGGMLVLEPPTGRVAGSLLCLNAGHEAAEVRP